MVVRGDSIPKKRLEQSQLMNNALANNTGPGLRDDDDDDDDERDVSDQRWTCCSSLS